MQIIIYEFINNICKLYYISDISITLHVYIAHENLVFELIN